MKGAIDEVVDAVRRAAAPLRDEEDVSPLAVAAGKRFVLIGEASHGTQEFYRHRAALTRRLIEDEDFTAVAVEADWPDAYRVNRFVRAETDDASAGAALDDFRRFPAWMWRNTEVLDFVTWLRVHNDGLPAHAPRTGFYGLDLYSLYGSMAAVIEYLERVDPEAAALARARYGCFDHIGDGQAYGAAAGLDMAQSCEQEVVTQLRELQRRAAERAPLGEDELFSAEQNARVARNAEAYYRSMFRAQRSSWNLRDRHMMETLEALVDHLDRRGGASKVVVWAHNSHLGDARATEMGAHGELNLGQLVRQRYGATAALIGYTTHSGSVTAASGWDGPPQRKLVRPALPDSYEAVFHAAGQPRFWLRFDQPGALDPLRAARLERAIGVIYLPESERISHYLQAVLPDQFDAVVHLDETSALEPLDRAAYPHHGDLPETFPTAV